jgi:hypothetical protein
MTHEMQHAHKAEGDSQPKVAAADGGVRSEAAKEMARVAPVLRVLAEDRQGAPGAAQWRRFEESLERRLDAGVSRGVRARLAQWVECWRATDSAALRAAGYAVAAALLAAFGFAVWEITQALGGEAVTVPVKVPAAAGWLLFAVRRGR